MHNKYDLETPSTDEPNLSRDRVNNIFCKSEREKHNGICEYCGTKQTLPKVDDETIVNLFNRANRLRMHSEFDKAEELYEKIINLDDTEAEAHWGIVLCKYGVEYVEDPKTCLKIPTCHRTLYEAVLTDVNYLAAVDNAGNLGPTSTVKVVPYKVNHYKYVITYSDFLYKLVRGIKR